MNALRKWVFEKSDGSMGKKGFGRLTELAEYLGVSQPAVTKMIQNGTFQDRRYARKIMEFTKIPAKELFPFWVEVFEYSDTVQDDELMKKREEIKQRMALLQDELVALYPNDDQNKADIEQHLNSKG
jgi:transcriptional regulator with XRE-family HTH domain